MFLVLVLNLTIVRWSSSAPIRGHICTTVHSRENMQKHTDKYKDKGGYNSPPDQSVHNLDAHLDIDFVTQGGNSHRTVVHHASRGCRNFEHMKLLKRASTMTTTR